MSYCLNPECQQPANPDTKANFCQSCGSSLLLKGRYRAIQPLGEGGFGVTYRAVDEHRLQTPCVIKQFQPQNTGSGTLKQSSLEKAVQLFHQEAMRLDELGEHPQIPTLLAHFEEDHRLYLIQQLVEGETLYQEVVKQGLYSEQDIRELLLDLLPVLQFVHDRQVVHRDIKPGNILRRKSDRRLVLIDFGIAKQVNDAALTLGGTKIGTEGYAPMEQWRSGKVYPASDLYSLAATCIFLLTGRRPDELFDPITGTWRWCEHLQSKGVAISAQLERILSRLLRDAVSERYQSASEVLRDLRGAEALEPKSRPSLATSTVAPALSWQLCFTLVGHSNRVRCLAMSPRQLLLASGSTDKTIKLWDIQSGALLRTLTGHTELVQSVVITPNGQTVISGSSDRTIKVWQVATGELVRTLTEHRNWVNAVAISRDGLLLASAGEDRLVKVWDTERWQLLATLAGHSGAVHGLAFSPDGNYLVSASSDRSLKLWHLQSGQATATLCRHSSRVNTVAFSPDGKVLASGSNDGTIKLWSFLEGKMLQSLTEHQDGVNSIAISADQSTLISGSSDQTVRLWQLDSGKLLFSLAGHTSAVNAVAVSYDSQWIASGSTDNSIQIWRVVV